MLSAGPFPSPVVPTQRDADVPNQRVAEHSNYGAEGYRVLWTLCGAGIGMLVMLLAGLLAKRTATAPPQPATQPA